METFTSLEECVELIAPRQVPALRHSIETYREMVAQGNDGIVPITNLVLMDPGLLISLFRRAIEVPRKSLQSDIRTADQAMMLLGSNNVEAVITESAILEDVLAEPNLSEYKKIVSRAYHSAYQAFDLARNQSDIASDEVFSATMLQETGSLVMWLHYPRLMQHYDPAMSEEEQQALFGGFTLNDLTRALAKQWGLSAFIQLTLDPEAKDKPRVKSVDLGVRVGWAAEKGWEGEDVEALMQEVAHYLHATPDEAMAEIRDNAEHAADETPFYEVEPAIAKLPPAEGEEHPKRQAADAQKEKEPQTGPIIPPGEIKRTTVSPATLEIKPAASKAQCPIPAALLAQQLANLERIVESDTLQLPQLMSTTMQALHEGVALNRAVFLMLSRDRSSLNSRFVIGTDDPKIKKLTIKMNQHGLFDVMLSKAQSLWLKDSNRAKLWPMLPAELPPLIEVDSFFLMSAHIKGKPVGIFYADRFDNHYGLDQNAYNYFRNICQLAAKGLVKLSR